MEIIINSEATLSFLPTDITLNKLKEKIEKLNLNKEKIKLINTSENKQTFYVTKTEISENAKDKDTLYIYINGYIYGESSEKTYGKTTIFGYNINKDTVIFNGSSMSTHIYTQEDKQIAEFIDNTLIINYNVFLQHGIEISTDIIAKILNEYIKMSVLSKEELKQLEHDRVINKTIKVIEIIKQEELKRNENRLQENERDINYAIKNLKKLYTRQNTVMNTVNILQNQLGDNHEKIKEELNKILNLDKVENIFSSEPTATINIKTKLLYGYTEHNRVYKLAPYTISIDFLHGYVQFNCPKEYKRRSCWGNYCPHPHISEIGEACFGNVASTIARLLADTEIFALTTILISYLENINVYDPAGEYCTNWDEVDEETKEIIREGLFDCPSVYFETLEDENDNEEIECAICGNTHLKSEMTYCENCEHYVCADCAIYIEDIDEWGCQECDDIIYCDECGLYYTTDNAITCDQCGRTICTGCSINTGEYSFCSEECVNKWESENCEEETEEEKIICPWCEEEITSEEELFTCEVCGRQGCSYCIQHNATRWECPECRGDI